MKKSLIGIAAAVLFCVIVLSGCEKDPHVGPEPVPEPPIAEDGYFISSKLVYSSFLDGLIDLIEDNIDGIDVPDFVTSGIELASERMRGMSVSIYEIQYKSKDVAGNDIVLSGLVSVPSYVDGSRMTLETVSLNHALFNLDNDITTVCGLIATLRASFRSLIVNPYCQGGGVDLGRPGTYIPVSDHKLKARQSIDCELAALEFLEKEVGQELNAGLSPDYFTYNIGVSNGAACALVMMSILESDSDYEILNRHKIHLNGTYMGEGCADYATMLDRFIDNYDIPSPQMDRMKPDVLMSMLNSAYKSHAIVAPKPYFFYEEGGVEKRIELEDYFTPEFNAARIEVNGEMLSFIEACDRGLWYGGLLEAFGDSRILQLGFTSLEDIFNASLFNEDGTLNKDRREWVAFMSALRESSIPEEFRPKTPLLIVSSTDDSFIPYEVNKEMYDILSGHGLNTNVKLRTLHGLDHSDASDLCWIASAFKKDICE